ncbi:N-acetylmuramoyl-L-alanine amidase [Vibrio astriarenae]|uniref:N-acetylmuramoyl-L-alanine amidase n=1 Tax=Vibrio astriarenae TaxID=1481923 RepID=UPI003735C465
MNKITIHSSATPASMDIGAKHIRQWHMAKGWHDIGYHWVIQRDGTLEKGRSTTLPGAHVKGHNRDNIGICLIGGMNAQHQPENNFTPAQMHTLQTALLLLTEHHSLGQQDIYAHNELNPNTSCPSFNLKQWLSRTFY